MKIKKGKLVFVTLVSAMTLMACGNSDTNGETPPDTTETSMTSEMDTAADTSASTTEDTTDTSSSDSTSTDSTSKGIENTEFDYSMEDAVRVFNDTFANAKITSVKIDNDSNSYVYEVEGYNDTNSVEIKMDANSGEVIKKDDSDDRDDNSEDDVLDLEGLVSPQEAMKAALDEVGSGYAKEWELDSKDGKMYYEIDVEDSKQANDDVHIDAKTGDFIGYD